MHKPIPFRALLLAAFAVQLLSLPLLWGHTSTPTEILGRYSTRYAAVLGLHIILTVVSLLTMILAPRIEQLLVRFPRVLTWVGYGGLAMAVIAVWTTSLEVHVLAYLSLNAVIAALLLASPEATTSNNRALRWGIGSVTVLMLIPLFLTALTVQGYHPDEAHYTDYASTFMATGMLYDSSWLETPYAIEPGWPWQLAAYGWLVETVGYTVYIGRVINFVAYLLCFAGLYAVGARLYNREAGLLAAVTGTLSIAFIPEWDYSPNHLLTPVGAWILYAWLIVATTDRTRLRLILAALVGFVATSSLNVHAAGVVFALAYSIWAGFDVIWTALRRQPIRRPLMTTIAFGVGALAGTILFYLTNIAPVGGLSVYLSVLGEWDGARRHPLFFYRWESLFEGVLIVFALVWLAWRRTHIDRFTLSAVGFTVMAAFLLDTQGYIWHFGPFYFLAVGAFLSESFAGERRRAVLVASVVGVMVVQVSAAFVDWRTVGQFGRTGTVPTYLYNDLKAVLPGYVTEDDVVYSTHQLIWLFPHTSGPSLVTYGAEAEGMIRFGVDSPVEVWEQVAPTVLITVEGQMSFGPGMVAYMERYPFEVCAEHTVQGVAVSVWRRGCG